MSALLFPCRSFRRQPPMQRRAQASRLLDIIQRLRAAHRDTGPASDSVRDLVAWVGIGHDLEAAAAAWRAELRRCWGAR
jgi:hypothetical protein